MKNQIEDYKKKIIQQANLLKPELTELSLRIHQHPELAFEEYQASQWLTNFLNSNGLKIEKNLAEIPTAFRAVTNGKSEKPTIGYLAEYDALPEIGHACGHNIIAVAAAGAAVVLKKAFEPEGIPGQVQVIGTPAEERGGGKVLLAQAGIFNDLDAAMMIHPGNKTDAVYRSLASQMVIAEYFGKSSHAAMAPEKGISALDALRLSFNMLDALRQHILPTSRIHGIIVNGGESPGTIPAYAKGIFSIRTAENEYMEELIPRIIKCLEAAGQATGATLKYQLSKVRYLAMRTNLTLAQVFSQNLEFLGVPVQKSDPKAGIGSSDMGNVSQVVPAIHAKMAIVNKEIEQHTPEFAVASRSAEGMEVMLNAVKTLAMTGMELLLNPELLKKVHSEFTASKNR